MELLVGEELGKVIILQVGFVAWLICKISVYWLSFAALGGLAASASLATRAVGIGHAAGRMKKGEVGSFC